MRITVDLIEAIERLSRRDGLSLSVVVNTLARRWLLDVLTGSTRVGLPWQSLTTFLRVATHPRILPSPVAPATAVDIVDDWLAMPAAWAPEPGRGYSSAFLGLVRDHTVTGNVVADAQLAALALEHGVAVASTDADFARWPAVRWFNPLA